MRVLSDRNNCRHNAPLNEDRENEVMEMHCNLLRGKSHEESTTASAADLIKSMSGGHAPHRAKALKLALRNGHSKGGGLLGRLFED